MSDNPTHYKFDHEVMSMIWVALHESGQEDLAQVVSDTMITQGCQELSGVAEGDAVTVLAFWKNFLEDKGLVHFSKNDIEELDG
jgi:hypothetical protein